MNRLFRRRSTHDFTCRKYTLLTHGCASLLHWDQVTPNCRPCCLFRATCPKSFLVCSEPLAQNPFLYCAGTRLHPTTDFTPSYSWTVFASTPSGTAVKLIASCRPLHVALLVSDQVLVLPLSHTWELYRLVGKDTSLPLIVIVGWTTVLLFCFLDLHLLEPHYT